MVGVVAKGLYSAMKGAVAEAVDSGQQLRKAVKSQMKRRVDQALSTPLFIFSYLHKHPHISSHILTLLPPFLPPSYPISYPLILSLSQVCGSDPFHPSSTHTLSSLTLSPSSSLSSSLCHPHLSSPSLRFVDEAPVPVWCSGLAYQVAMLLSRQATST